MWERSVFKLFMNEYRHHIKRVVALVIIAFVVSVFVTVPGICVSKLGAQELHAKQGAAVFNQQKPSSEASRGLCGTWV